MAEEFCGAATPVVVEETKLGHSRRSALKGLAALLGTIGATSLATSAHAAAKTYKVCKTTDVAVGKAKIFAVGGTTVVISQPTAGSFKAFNGYCPHLNFPLAASSGAVNVSGTNMVCYKHSSKFNISTGAVTSGPAKSGLKKYTISVSGTQVSVTF